ncbi:MAG: glutathione synthase [Candidatus Melainabacteria bacterium RIFOXYA12_FULL_32_12]|nr:MAG: glutathione synthase [Candidatus Melainabacteria bacterium RIFOXYA2_FULL_32_9]OGI24844.1 MAG: glutathione synthase [Candidatus Melainabacteria bacterium RIFOXYA12_FULL_32_12]
MSKYKIGFLLDEKDLPDHPDKELSSSFLILQECLLRNHEIYIFPIENLFLNNNIPKALAYQVKHNYFEFTKKPFNIDLNDLDIILIRQNPPINTNYIFSTHILNYVDQSKTIVINSPSGIRKCNEKLYIYNFPKLAPEGITTSNIDLIQNFLNEHNEIIVKPLDNYAGNGIFYLKKGDKNLNSILEETTNNEKTLILAQKYLNKAKYGDKRLILLGGEPVASIIRLPCKDDFRANMCKGGHLKKSEITDEDREICKTISKNLLEDGLFFVGLDIIDDKLIEINVTSPGFFIRKINPMFNIRLEKKIVDYMERLLVDCFISLGG